MREAGTTPGPGQILRVAVPSFLLLFLVACGGSGRVSHPAAHGSSSAQETTTAPELSAEPLPFNAGGLLAGSAHPSFPEGEPNKMSVVQVGPLTVHEGGSAKLPFAFRNNTSETISFIDWTGLVRSEGTVIKTGSSQGTIPARVKSGEVGLAFIYFDDRTPPPPPDAKYEFSVNSTTTDADLSGTALLKATEANMTPYSIVGAAINNTGKSVEGPFSVAAYCFDGNNLLSEADAFAEPDDFVAAGNQVTFTVDLFGADCPTFTVGVSGYFAA
ncbi:MULTISPECIES: hypothetical protein [Mycobacterium]|uniref:Uncharacterized protein n=1 Tax=Mycobacterium pseudoshottsii TaxID=265949 RepID=A0A9N7LSI9_9MYCO|nr:MULTISPECIES: hypothetical protein [Mycobacterium]EPQ48360.1 hypothetical protein MMSP_4121 [Mycobacterium sp. 012931]MBC9860601.1 hypothetical protein [Mycobacterium pseudoshottsii]RFZ60519.1 hypothetical protein DL240490_03921 [Mycobacterium marinum]BBA87654.1 hypothetical protein MPSD_20850 [Mycobacterium pseudoshottsii JCM 15466]BDN81838.1 hypothetical protein NJB1907Z4_C20530 [Mycobacterium pseudoshottsii]